MASLNFYEGYSADKVNTLFRQAIVWIEGINIFVSGKQKNLLAKKV
jgi:hypothetical protein